MAVGLLGSATATPSGSGSTVVYTVPASGVSHAVVHITLSASDGFYFIGPGPLGWVTVNNHVVLSPVWGVVFQLGTTNYVQGSGNSVSMMLSPGDVVLVTCNGSLTSSCSCTVSGYEVPS